MTKERFEGLLPEFEAANTAVEAVRQRVVVQMVEERKRRLGGRGKHQNDLTNRILTTLLSLRPYCSQEFICYAKYEPQKWLFEKQGGGQCSQGVCA